MKKYLRMSSAAVMIGTLRVKLFCTVQPYATGLIMLSLTLAVIDPLQVKDLIFTSFLVQHAGSANCSMDNIHTKSRLLCHMYCSISI